MSREAIIALKSKIKQLSSDQKADKTLIRLPNNGRGSPEWKKKAAATKYGYINPQWDILQRAAKITAALNLYHELRGSDYRHGTDPSRYAADVEILRKELEETCVST